MNAQEALTGSGADRVGLIIDGRLVNTRWARVSSSGPGAYSVIIRFDPEIRPGHIFTHLGLRLRVVSVNDMNTRRWLRCLTAEEGK